MTARSLHIVDVYDVGCKGKAQEVLWASVLHRGEIAVFYAFDQMRRGSRREIYLQSLGRALG